MLSLKVHVQVSADDNFSLNRSVQAFQRKVARLGANMAIDGIRIPGTNHFTVWNYTFTKQIQNEIVDYSEQTSI